MHIGKRYATNEEDAKDIVNSQPLKTAQCRMHQ
jgi:hypothetical protein